MGRKKGYVTKSFTFECKRYYITAPDEATAIKKVALKQRDLEEGKVAVCGSMAVRAWAEKAVETYKTNQSEITRQSYVQRMNHCILEQIGHLQLKSVKPINCQQVLNMQHGKSKKQINEVYQTLNFIFRTAVENHLIISNPAENMQKPKGTVRHRRPITDAEREHLLNVCEQDTRYRVFLLMLYCGCRPSEAMNCQGMDLQKIEGENVLHIRGTKTGNADRIVPVPDALYKQIKGTPKFDYIASNGGKQWSPKSTYRRVTKSLYRALNISMGCKVYRSQLIPPLPLAKDFVPYCLRHTYCTDLQKAGVDIRTAQYLMGHSDIALTANIYTHADNSTVLEAARILKGTTGGTTLKGMKRHINDQ